MHSVLWKPSNSLKISFMSVASLRREAMLHESMFGQTSYHFIMAVGRRERERRRRERLVLVGDQLGAIPP